MHEPLPRDEYKRNVQTDENSIVFLLIHAAIREYKNTCMNSCCNSTKDDLDADSVCI